VAKIRLLLADESEIFREGLAKLLEHEPSIEVVCTCRTGLEAVESANKYQPDIILIDIGLSECSGIDTGLSECSSIDTGLSECSSTEAIQRIHERLPKTAIIVLTCSKLNDDFVSAIKAGARAYISKDIISLENLIKTVILVAEGEVIVSFPMTARLLLEFNSLGERKDVAKLGYITPLSERERSVLALVAQGLTNREVAATLFISEHTVKVHLRNIMEKFHVHTRQQAVALAAGKRHAIQGNRD